MHNLYPIRAQQVDDKGGMPLVADFSTKHIDTADEDNIAMFYLWRGAVDGR